MTARRKLNAVVLAGVVLIAGAVGFATGSWVAFGVAVVALTALTLYVGLLRVMGRHKQP